MNMVEVHIVRYHLKSLDRLATAHQLWLEHQTPQAMKRGAAPVAAAAAGAGLHTERGDTAAIKLLKRRLSAAQKISNNDYAAASALLLSQLALSPPSWLYDQYAGSSMGSSATGVGGGGISQQRVATLADRLDEMTPNQLLATIPPNDGTATELR